MVLGVLRSSHGGGLCSWPIFALAFLFSMAVILAGRDFDPRFDWTFVRRRSLTGTEVGAVPGGRPGSLDDYCSLTMKSWLYIWRKLLLEALCATPCSWGSLYLFFGRGKCDGDALAVLARCSSISSPSSNSAVRSGIPGAADSRSRNWSNLNGFVVGSKGDEGYDWSVCSTQASATDS